MFDRITAVAVVAMVVMVTLLNTDNAAAGPIKPQQIPEFASVVESLGRPDETELHRRIRRTYNRVDTSCKGYFSRSIWSELSYVCEDCSNLYRKSGFQAECRKGCFSSSIFHQCLIVLGKDVDKYQDKAASLRGS